MPIELSDKQSLAWQYLEDKITTEILYGGAAGGGKSYLLCIWHIWRRQKYPGSRGLIARKTLKSIKESTLITFYNVCKELGYESEKHYQYNEQKGTITWANGSVTILKELMFQPSDPNYDSLGSTEYTDACIEEAPEIVEKAFEIVSSRIRYKLDEFGLAPKVLLTCNPSHGWIKKRFIKLTSGELVKLKPHQRFVPALVTDNPNKDFVNIYMQQLNNLTSEYDKRRLLLGDWDAKETKKTFVLHFNRDKHVSLVKLDLNKQLFISIDFNLTPFGLLAAHIWFDKDGWHYHKVDELLIKDGSIPAMIDAIRTRYSPWLPMLKLTGDAMGKRGDLSQRDNSSYYLQIRRGLNLRESQLVTPANPTHENSRADVNYVYYHHPDCKTATHMEHTIFDLENVEVDNEGKILKSNRLIDSQRADMLDCDRYMINAFLKSWIKIHQNSSPQSKKP